jgi:Family of unknown function (DUF6335)
MARRKSSGRSAKGRGARKRAAVRGSVKRPKLAARKRSGPRKKASRGRARAATGPKRPSARKTAPKLKGGAARPAQETRTKLPRLDRARRTLEDTVPTPPSSLNMDRHGSAARSGREEMEDNLRKHGTISPGITGGDVDADFEQAYFSGDEAPGGDNPTPDQEVVDDIGRALGVEYQDNEELKSSDKLAERDRHRWELDPASSEDYKDRD